MEPKEARTGEFYFFALYSTLLLEAGFDESDGIIWRRSVNDRWHYSVIIIWRCIVIFNQNNGQNGGLTARLPDQNKITTNTKGVSLTKQMASKHIQKVMTPIFAAQNTTLRWICDGGGGRHLPPARMGLTCSQYHGLRYRILFSIQSWSRSGLYEVPAYGV